MLARTLFTICLVGMAALGCAQDEPSDTLSTSDTLSIGSICDTAGTDVGVAICFCAQRDTAELRMQIVYNQVMEILNKRLAALRSDPVADSSSIAEVEEFSLAIQQSQEAWLAYREAQIGLWFTIEGNRLPRGGGACQTSLEITVERISNLGYIKYDLELEWE